MIGFLEECEVDANNPLAWGSGVRITHQNLARILGPLQWMLLSEISWCCRVWAYDVASKAPQGKLKPPWVLLGCLGASPILEGGHWSSSGLTASFSVRLLFDPAITTRYTFTRRFPTLKRQDVGEKTLIV
jgi:hypothetical protein